MKTRLLRPEENWKSNLTMAVAFEGDYDLEKAKESAARERTEEEKREDARNRCFGTFLDDDETICGVVNSREYLCRFDGGTYKLGGGGGGSSLAPWCRRCFYIAAVSPRRRYPRLHDGLSQRHVRKRFHVRFFVSVQHAVLPQVRL